MGTTTNYGWNYPESTDLVKDGATAIQTLAEEIDTTAATLGGMTLVNKTTFSAVISQSLDNVFTSDYKNYRIDIHVTNSTAAGGQVIYSRLRVGGVTTTAGNYTYGRSGYSYASALNLDNGAGGVFWFWQRANGSGSQDGEGVTSVTLFSPAIATRTWYTGGAADGLYSAFIGGVHVLETAYDGIEIGLTGTGTMTGEINVYGLK